VSAADIPERPAQPAVPTTSLGPFARLSDVLNPILVREVQQAIKGRVFPLTILVALAISVVIASVVASDEVSASSGRRAFDAGFATLAPLLLFVVPMQAYNSMRTELKGGIVEQLLMSRLSPGRVLFGKLQAAMVQFLLYVSILSPLLATSYLLRGVDLLTIVVSLFFALVACVAATAFAVSSAAQAVVPALQPIANLGIAFGLGLATFGAVAGIVGGEYAQGMGYLLRSNQVGMVISALVLAAVLSTTLSWLAARSYLLHTFENKSTGFRLFLWSLPVVGYGWMLGFVEPGDWQYVFPGMSVGLVFAAIAFGVFMVTEQQEFSPRVYHHVPVSRGLAMLATPFLPGRDRGLLCFSAFSIVLLLVGLLFWPSSSGFFGMAQHAGRIGLMALAYGMVYLLIGRWLRARLPNTVQASQAGRVVLPVVLVVFCILPLLIDGLTRARGVDDWHLGHVMNPFWTISHFTASRWNRAMPFVVGVLIVATLVQVPIWLRGMREVAQASAERRARRSGALADPTDGREPAHAGAVAAAVETDPAQPDLGAPKASERDDAERGDAERDDAERGDA
jgi:hypothetical protein